jgi:hypothetical protein
VFNFPEEGDSNLKVGDILEPLEEKEASEYTLKPA